MNRKKGIDKKKMQRRLMRSPAYRIAYKDRRFLDSPLARPARLELELLKTEIGMIENNVKSTIVTFGGTRIQERSEAERKVRALQNRLKKNPKDKNLRRKLRIARSVLQKSSYYQEAREFARLVSSECQIRGPPRICHRNRGRPGYHGGGQSGRIRRRREISRPEYHPAP